MVKQEWYDEARNLVIAYSNKNKKLIQAETGEEYDEAVDLFDHRDEIDNTPRSRYSYIESDKDIPPAPPIPEEKGEVNATNYKQIKRSL